VSLFSARNVYCYVDRENNYMIKSVRRMVSVAVLLILVTFPSVLFTSKAADSASLMAQTDAAIELAFNEVLEAEKAGANVTGMLSTLNLAAGVLAQTENSDASLVPGVIDSDLSRLQAAYDSAQSVQANAMEAKVRALNANRNGLLSTVAFSLVGGIGFILVLFAFWRRYERGYRSFHS
jgi:methionine-rich copper-binding protein CopC